METDASDQWVAFAGYWAYAFALAVSAGCMRKAAA